MSFSGGGWCYQSRRCRTLSRHDRHDIQVRWSVFPIDWIQCKNALRFFAFCYAFCFFCCFIFDLFFVWGVKIKKNNWHNNRTTYIPLLRVSQPCEDDAAYIYSISISIAICYCVCSTISLQVFMLLTYNDKKKRNETKWVWQIQMIWNNFYLYVFSSFCMLKRHEVFVGFATTHTTHKLEANVNMHIWILCDCEPFACTWNLNSPKL